MKDNPSIEEEIVLLRKAGRSTDLAVYFECRPDSVAEFQ